MNPQSAVDLHLHSTASDGILSPRALVAHAASHGVRLLALTDHDTVRGLDEAAAEAGRLGLAFVPGIELSAGWEGRTLHVLGYGIDPATPMLLEALRGLDGLRQDRASRIAARLSAAGLPGSEILEELATGASVPTRTHFARALVRRGCAPDMGSVFKRWLGRGRPACVTAEWPAMGQVLDWIGAAGGVASLAHPMRYTLSNGARRRLCAEFRDAGGAALEVITGGGSAADREQSISLAVRTGLGGSVGSDFHDPGLPWNTPGRLAKLPGSIRPVWRDPPFPEFTADTGMA